MSVMATADINRAASETATPALEAKPERVSLVELKNGKLLVKQKPISFEKMSETLQEIVQFREMVEERIERKDAALAAIPDEHRPLIAKLTQESDKTLAALSKHIQQELLPAQDEDDEEGCKEIQAALPLELIEKAVKGIATRVNYGLDVSKIPQVPLGAKIPVAWQVWRWELKDEYREWLPKASRDKALVRLCERRQATEDVLALFLSLPENDRAAVLAGNAKIATTNAKPPATPATVVSVKPMPEFVDPAPTPTETPSTPSNPLKRKATDAADENSQEKQGDEADTPTKGPRPAGRPKKAVDPEKAAKEKEKLEKKLAKAEKEKKDKEAQSRSRSLMVSFFGKPKPSTATAAGGSSSSGAPSASSSPVIVQGLAKEAVAVQVPDFERTFKPFLLKKDASIAPTNWFLEVRKGRAKTTYKGKEKESDVIVIDDDDEGESEGERREVVVVVEDEDVQMVDASDWKGQQRLDLGQMTAEERLRDSLKSLHPRLRPPSLPFPPRRHPTLKSHHPHVVRSIMARLTEAEVAGEDPSVVRAFLASLRDRTQIPAKVLVFHEDARPGYFGTWTRNSREVGPRAPFARDVVSIDYAVDSEAEWEEQDEGEGEVLDGGEDDGEDDGAGAEDVDSDLDSWLVDDDEPVEPGTPVEERFGSPDFPLIPLPPPKRKAKVEEETKEQKTGSKKKRVVEHLVQFEKGPCWEGTIGECAWEPFKAMRIEFFNDTPCPIDPFSFVAAPLEHLPTAPAANGKPAPQPLPGSFAVPALPSHIATSTSTPSDSPSAGGSGAPKRPPPAPKTSFPEASMPVLCAKVKELNTGSLAVIIESIYKELGAATKKNAIEAKLREVGEKSKDGGGAGKVWVVKPEIRALYSSA